MFRHVVMFRFAESTTADQRAAVVEGLGGLAAAVPEVRNFSFGPDAAVNDGNFSLVVVADFDDREGYAAYAANPVHRQFVSDVIAPVVSERSAVQYELPD